MARLKYFSHSLANSFIFVLMTLLLPVVFADSDVVFTVFIIIFLIFYFYIEVCLTVRRFHDLDRPGEDYFLLFIPLYNIILGFILQFKKGTIGPNRFGEDPLQKDSTPAVPLTVPPSAKDFNVPAYTIAPPALKEDRNLIPVYIAAAAILIAVGYFVYWAMQTSQKKPDYISTATSNKMYDEDSTLYQVSDSSFLSREAMIKLFNDLWAADFSGTKHLTITAGSEAVILDLDKGMHGTVLSVYRFNLIENSKLNLSDAGFQKHPEPFIATSEILQTLQYKYFYEHDGRINIQVGTDLAEIHYFIDYLIGNLLIIDKNSKLSVGYE